jgi:hypothetical protein
MSNARYDSYRTTLLGKQLAEQYLEVFENKKSKLVRYSNTSTEDDRFWIISIAKVMLDDTVYYHDSMKPIKGAYTYTLYLSKNSDLAILVAPIIRVKYSPNYSNNIATYYKYILKKLNYSKVEFKRNQRPFGKYGPYSISDVKILVSQNKTDDDLIKVINTIERFNEYVLNTDLPIWDNFQSIKENVKFDI